MERIDVSEGIDVTKTSESKECNICHYCFFLKKCFKFQPNGCNGCHDLLTTPMNFSDITILNMKCVDCHCFISEIIKSEVINSMQNIDLTEKRGTL